VLAPILIKQQLIKLPTNSIIVKIRRCFADADEEEYADGRWAA
jgi:hypothetical protein